MIIYAAAITISACLLFLVQPLIAKIILPWFGGTSAVWSAALVFFQVCLLGGYAYAHWLTTRVPPRLQRIVHGVLLIVACALMPILPSESWRPTPGNDPTLRILLLLSATVGLPSVLLSATSPLLQAWYLRRKAGEDPYWLFALSNFGSMLALLSFPLLLEPQFSSRTLAIGWSMMFAVFTVLAISIAWASRNDALPVAATEPVAQIPPPTPLQTSLWVIFAACASAMLVSLSTHLSTNVAPIPLLWVLPLALYLLTFILTFSHPRSYNRRALFPLLAVALGAIAYLYTHGESNWHIRYSIPIYLAALFIVCLTCHGEIVRRRPAPGFLTRFYLLIALGGAIGGSFVAVLAPLVFDNYLELPLLLVAVAALGVMVQWHRTGSTRTLWPVRLAMIGGVIALTGYLAMAEKTFREADVLVRRNFYGVLRVRDTVSGAQHPQRDLIHGTISHGYQYLHDPLQHVPGAYFGPKSGVGRFMKTLSARRLEREAPVRCGVIGLGAGILGAYVDGCDEFVFYEVNPDVLDIAEHQFTFLSYARARAAKVDVRIGDARLSLEAQAPQNLDLLVVDAFSSDAIPAHLLTNEAAGLFVRHLKPDGVLAMHISNRYLNLEPVCLRAAEHVGRKATVISTPSDDLSYASIWVLITSDERFLSEPQYRTGYVRPAQADPGFAGWSDQYSSVWPILKLEDTPQAIAAEESQSQPVDRGPESSEAGDL